ncbi:hypothetical protein, partial [Alteromonas sp.]|uniref:hypothetical protein n=1 Tax=Alteromonas sp. TaxID=232 RepID=UPI00257FDD17
MAKPATIGAIFHPLYARMLARFNGHKNRSALLTLVVICITVILPFGFVAVAFAEQAAGILSKVQSGDMDPAQALEWVNTYMPAALELLDK